MKKNPTAVSECLENTITKMKNSVDELTGWKEQREESLNFQTKQRKFPTVNTSKKRLEKIKSLREQWDYVMTSTSSESWKKNQAKKAR